MLHVLAMYILQIASRMQSWDEATSHHLRAEGLAPIYTGYIISKTDVQRRE